MKKKLSTWTKIRENVESHTNGATPLNSIGIVLTLRLIYFFNKYLLSNCYETGIMKDIPGTVTNKTE